MLRRRIAALVCALLLVSLVQPMASGAFAPLIAAKAEGDRIDISGWTLNPIDDAGLMYTGSPVVLDYFNLYDDKGQMTEGKDYTLSYSNNVNAGQAILTITGIGSYTGSIRQTFTIHPRDISNDGDFVIQVKDQVYTGNVIHPVPDVSFMGSALGMDRYSCSWSSSDDYTAVGTHTFTVNGMGNFTGSRSAKFNIVENTLPSRAVTVTYVGATPTKVYDGTTNCGTYVSSSNYTPLISESDFKVTGMASGDSYKINANYLRSLKFDSKHAGSRTVSLANLGSYITFTSDRYNYSLSSGSVKSITGRITPKTLTITPRAGQSKVYGESDPAPFKGSLTGMLSLDSASGGLGRASGENVGTYKFNLGTLKITDKSTGEVSQDYDIVLKDEVFTITAKSIATSSDDITIGAIGNQQWTGSAITPAVSIEYAAKTGVKTLVKGTDYTVSYSNNINAGTATVAITGKGNYTGTRTISFRIIKAGVDPTPTPTPTPTPGGTVTPTPTPTPTPKPGQTVTPTPGGTVTPTPTPTPRPISKAAMDAIPDQVHTGSAIEPEIVIRDGSRVLKEGIDYTVSFANNVKVGTATVSIAGIGEYGGQLTGTFRIVKSGLPERRVGVALKDDVTVFKYYDGTTAASLEPADITLSGIYAGDNVSVLSIDADYDSADIGQDRVVTIHVTLSSDSAQYRYVADDTTVTGTILAMPIANSRIRATAIPAQGYTGSALTPAVVLKFGEMTLKNGKDFTVAYTGNVNVGTATATIRGIGNFSGTRKLTFKIVDDGSGEYPVMTLPASLRHIEDEAFMGSGAYSIVIPEGCLSIGSKAFAGCPNLRRVVIPGTVTQIADDAFTGSSRVVIVTDATSIKTWADSLGISCMLK